MGLAFAAPLALLGLLALPVIYWLLRVTPPAPREIIFPPVRLLRDLKPREETPLKTPWPLLLLRLAIAALASLALAGPIWNPAPAATASGPLLVAIDDGWAAAPSWDRRIAAAASLIEGAERAGTAVALMLASEAATTPELTDGARAAEQLRAARPKPWLPDRGAAATQAKAFASARKGGRLVWIADGLEQGGAAEFAAALRDAAAAGAGVELLKDEATPLALQGAANDSAALEVSVLRAGQRGDGVVEALDDKARLVATAPFQFAGSDIAKARFELPIELRNEISFLRVTGENSAGAVALLDARGRVRRVAIVGGAAGDAAQPLLSAAYYLEKALAPFTLLLKSNPGDADPVLAALANRPNVLVLADEKVAPGEAFDALSAFVEQGGVLLRFAGPRLANDPDELTPVRLRRNGRVLGGAMSWETPKRLADFDESSPFYGLVVPADVAVTRQILAEPDPGLSAKTWARLADGTPLTTFERRGKGVVVLFHVGADANWSNLPISGLFVEMLKRICALSNEGAADRSASAADADRSMLAPLRALDGFGVLGAPPATAKPIGAELPRRGDAEHPPGFYGAPGAEIAVQTLAPDDALRAFDFSRFGLSPRSLDRQAAARDLRPLLLTLIFIGLLIDWLVLLKLSGRLRLAAVRVALVVFCALGMSINAHPARADAQKSDSSAHERDAALKTRLAYVISGDARIDETSRSGLETLSRTLDQRTSFSPGDPVAVDVARDELAFYPLLYWPINALATQPNEKTVARVAAYMKQGGTVIFDTRDALTARANAAPTPEASWLRELAKGLDIPELEIVPRDHVITKTFYLLDNFVGRYANGDTWVEALPPEAAGDAPRPVRATDNVSAIVITSNDLAAAWAQDKSGRPLYPLTPGGARQREMSLRGGVNLVMYTLTGNYKSDQVHVRDLLQRLGQ
jgi:hypothetical protein